MGRLIYIILTLAILLPSKYSNAQWRELMNVPGGMFVDVVSNSRGELIAYHYTGQVYLSIDTAKSWELYCEMPQTDLPHSDLVFTDRLHILSIGNDLMHFDGSRWYSITGGLSHSRRPVAYAYDRDSTLAVIMGDSLYLSTNMGRTWNAKSDMPKPRNTGQYPLFFDDSDALYYRQSDGVLISTNMGEEWGRLGTTVDLRQTDPNGKATYIAKNGNIYCMTRRGIIAWDDHENSWSLVKRFEYPPSTGRSIYLDAEDHVYVISRNLEEIPRTKIEVSTNEGSSWAEVLPWEEVSLPDHICYAGNGHIVVYRHYWVIYRLSRLTAEWTPAMRGIHGMGNALVALDDNLKCVFQPVVRCISTESDDSWTLIHSYPPKLARDLVVLGNKCIVRAQDAELAWSPDLTRTWYSVPAISNHIIAGTDSSIILASPDGNIMEVGQDLSYVDVICEYTVSKVSMNESNRIFGADSSGRIVLINMDGTNLFTHVVPMLRGEIVSIIITGSGSLLVQNRRALYRSLDQGQTWEMVADSSSFVFAKMLEITGGLVGLSLDGQLLFSDDVGKSWDDISIEDSRIRTYDIAANTRYMYATTNGYGIYRYDIKVLTISNEGDKPRTSVSFAFPNPVNRDQDLMLGCEGHMEIQEIRIYDFLGREVAVVAPTTVSESIVVVQLRRLNLGFGIHFYKMITSSDQVLGSFIVSR